jgi:hypothetical protein
LRGSRHLRVGAGWRMFKEISYSSSVLVSSIREVVDSFIEVSAQLLKIRS